MINITLPDGNIKTFENPPTGSDAAKSISEGFARNCVAMELDDNLVDLNTVITRRQSQVYYHQGPGRAGNHAPQRGPCHGPGDLAAI